MNAAVADSLNLSAGPPGRLTARVQAAFQHWQARQQAAWVAWLDSAEGQRWLEEQADIAEYRRAGIYD